MTTQTISLAEARRIALAAQGFGRRKPNGSAGWRRIRGAIERMGLLQIDSVCAVCRSHYLPVYSRIGAYDAARLDTGTYHPRRREMFEYWGHEASFLPFAMHPLLRWRMARARRLDGIYSGTARFVRERADFVANTLAAVRDRGPVTARELNDGGRSGGMWERHDAKVALEYLFWTGQVTSATRRGFERIYDLPERVLPAEIMALATPPEEEAQRALVAIAARALGIATEPDLRDYFRLPTADSKRRVAELVEQGALLEVEVEGWRQPAYLDPDARTPRRVRASALLSPFDPLVWERKRTERLFGFRYRLEIYTPAPKRRHGYYVLPFLLDERLVARVDLKVDRAAGTLRVLAAYGEDGADQDETAAALARELREIASWLGLERIVLSRRGDLTPSLRKHRRHLAAGATA